ncbi:hypothetical protein [Bacillus subtilis]|uniref:hypothetical protein n=1 Tax=Bacillus subtilis TaxID=1423 RepID=UPI0010660E77|nr:hypothetical protein [Bacillus subtilis]TDY53729.1 hypothetical protein BJ795_3595 [Bacillus subtilis]
MQFDKEFVEEVARGGNMDEVKKLSPLEIMNLGIAVRRFEEQQGIKRDAVQFDNDKIGKFMAEHTRI